MAANDPYTPDPVELDTSGGATTTTNFDGSGSSTNAAIVTGLMGTLDCEVYLEAWDGSSWQVVAQLTDDQGNTTFSADWHSQFNRLVVATDARRIRIDSVDSSSGGWVAVEGDERGS